MDVEDKLATLLNVCTFHLTYLPGGVLMLHSRRDSFFPRVRTPCGHGAQVIVEGREKQSDGGEKNKDHKSNPKTTTKGPQAESPPSCSLSSVLGETGETKKSV